MGTHGRRSGHRRGDATGAGRQCARQRLGTDVAGARRRRDRRGDHGRVLPLHGAEARLRAERLDRRGLLRLRHPQRHRPQAATTAGRTTSSRPPARRRRRPPSCAACSRRSTCCAPPRSSISPSTRRRCRPSSGSTCASLLGVLLAVPMRRHFVVDEKLPFPDGMAAGETLIVLDPPRGARPAATLAWRRAPARGHGAGASASSLSGLVMLLRERRADLRSHPRGLDPGALTPGRGGRVIRARDHGRRRRLQPAQLGAGMLVGLRVNTWMLLGGVIGWIVAPLLLIQHGVLPDHPTRTPGALLGHVAGDRHDHGRRSHRRSALRWRLLARSLQGPAQRRASRARSSRSPGSIGGVGRAHRRALRHPEAFFGLPIWMTPDGDRRSRCR